MGEDRCYRVWGVCSEGVRGVGADGLGCKYSELN